MDGPVLSSPEPKWLWRRVYTFVLTAVLLAMVGWAVIALAKAGAVTALMAVCIALCILVLVLVLVYLVAPSAEYVHRIAEVVAAAKDGRPPHDA